MKIKRILWLESIVEKLAQKHSIQQHEVLEVLSNNPHFRFVEKGFRSGENVYTAMGQTFGGRYLIVFFVFKKSDQALILSARDMTQSERAKYEQR